jgi:ABC-2 type transport system ATP-binding protein
MHGLRQNRCVVTDLIDEAGEMGQAMSTSASRFAVRTQQLSKRYGPIEAVRQLDMNVPLGPISGFLGQNGAGKSTTLKMLMGAVRPSSGSGQMFGLNIADRAQSVEIRKRVAFVSEDKRLYDYMTVEQIIRFTRSFFPKWRSDLEAKFLKQFPLPLDRKIKKLSKGMRTQLALLLGISRGAEMLVLDEPTEGLDPVAIETVLELLKSLAPEGVTILFSSHQIAEVEQIAAYLFMIHRGELVLSSSIDRLKDGYRRLVAVFDTPVNEKDLAMEGVKRIATAGAMVTLVIDHDSERIIEHLRCLKATNIDVLPVTLKEIFLQNVGAK